MKKHLLILCVCIFISSCGTLGNANYAYTSFYVKNNSSETVNFSSTVVVFPMSRGPLTRHFSVPPKDSILARQIDFKNGAEPQKWFLEFNIFPNPFVKLFDPNKAENWIIGTDSKGKTTYTFTIAE